MNYFIFSKKIFSTRLGPTASYTAPATAGAESTNTTLPHRRILKKFEPSKYTFMNPFFVINYEIMYNIFLSRVSMQFMQSAIWLYSYSVRLFVCPMPILCVKEWTYRHTFWHSGRGILRFLGPNGRYKISRPWEPLSGRIFFLQISPFISETVRDRPIDGTLIRSHGCPIVMCRFQWSWVHDLQRRDGYGQNFFLGSP